MKIYKRIGFKLFVLLSLLLTAFMCILVFLQIFIVGRTYTISQYTLEKERNLNPLLWNLIYKSIEKEFSLPDIETFEHVNDVNLVVFDGELTVKYITYGTRKVLKSQYLNYIRVSLKRHNPYDTQRGTYSFRIYDRFNLPTKYIAFVNSYFSRGGPQFIVTVIPEVFTLRASSIIRGYIAYIFIILLALILAVSALFSYFVTKPVRRISKTASEISELDFSKKCEVRHEDEIGDLARTINNMSVKLEDTISSLSLANEKLQKDLDIREELDLLRKEFIGAVTHEFKTPITLIRGYTESIKDGVAYGEDREIALDTIIGETEKMDKLVRDLLDLSKMEAIGYKLNVTGFYIDELLDNISKKYQKAMEERNIRFITDINSVRTAEGDPFRIEQVITNFLNNAIENTPPGKEIRLVSQAMDEDVVISVYNQGKNIDEDEINRIWEKFYRIEKSRNKSLGGTGLGLAISRAILELHKSSYGAQNTPDGVRFFFSLKKKETI